jgi:ATP-dependent Lhr-like helicase
MRYGVVTRDWWRRERPPVAWRAIYRELKRLEYRGEVRRGYFVRGLGGAQFALPDAVERLRESRDDANAPLVVMAASDPANPYALPLEGMERVPLTRPRGASAVLVTRRGAVVLAAEGRGARVMLAADLSAEAATAAATALGEHLASGVGRVRSRRAPVVRTIDGIPANGSPHAGEFLAAGWRRETDGLSYGAATFRR